MRQVEPTLADWLALYGQFCEAKRLLAGARSRCRHVHAQLRRELVRLQAAVDRALQLVGPETMH